MTDGPESSTTSPTGRDWLFVTGATGPTGSHAATQLLAAGWRLRCLVRSADQLGLLPVHEALETVEGNLNEISAWQNALEGSSAMVHLAHIGFAPQVIKACETHGVGRLLCLSSTRRFTRFPDETARLVIQSEAAVEASSLDYTILRASMIYGSTHGKNVNKIVHWLERRRWMPLVHGGRNLVQPIYDEDLIAALIAALERPSATGRCALTIAGPEPLTWRTMAETIAQSMDRTIRWIPVPYAAAFSSAALIEFLSTHPFITRAQVRRLMEDRSFDINKATEALGSWRPRDFEQGMSQMMLEAARERTSTPSD